MTQNPVQERRYIFLRSARVILNDALFLELLNKKEYPFIVALSQNKLVVPDSVAQKRKKTVNISLERSPQEILQSFHNTTRNEVRRTFHITELTVTRDDNNFDRAYALYKTFRHAKNLPVKPPSFLQQAMRWSAYWNGELLAVITCYDVPPYMRIQHIFSRLGDREMQKRVGYVTRRLVYEACAYGSASGRVFLDMASVNMDNSHKKGITAFKLSFGGVMADEYIYTYRSPLVRFVRRFQ